MSNNINGTGGAGNIKWSRDLATRLDEKDGKKDGKISASVWNGYLSEMGSKGNRIQNYITVDNAVKSFDYYKSKKDKDVVDWNNWEAILNNGKKTPPTPVKPKEDDLTPIAETPEDPTGVDETPETPNTPDTNAPVGTYTEGKGISNGADGIIDKAAQGELGDCWLITGLMSLSETKWGRQAIKDAMQINPDTGDIKITLKGAYRNQKVFTVTKSELEAAKQSGKYSHGDDDVLAFELAIEKYRKQFGETLDGGHEEEVFRLITGSHNTQFIESKGGMRSLIQKAKADPDKYAISANFELGTGAGRDKYHAYNVSRFETGPDGVNYVILTNPWVSNREIKMTEEEFVSRAYEMQVLANPTGKTSAYQNNADGKIGNTTSSRKNLDNNVASAIYAVANSDPQLIKDCIKVNSNGSITVTLKGVGKSYTISAKELDKARDSGRYTQGDDDVLALEIAMEKYGKEKEYGDVRIDDSAGLDGWAVRAGTEIYGISDSTAIFLLTGQKNMYAKLDDEGKYTISDSPVRLKGIDPNILLG